MLDIRSKTSYKNNHWLVCAGIRGFGRVPQKLGHDFEAGEVLACTAEPKRRDLADENQSYD